MSLDEFLGKLEGVRQHGRYYTARCPVSRAHSHGDRNPSLSVILQENDWIQPTCHAGCTRESILEALGLENLDLLTSQVNYGKPLKVWTYQDAKGKDVFQSVRFPPKRFRQRFYSPGHADADAEGWVWKLDGIERVLYRLPEVVEGVKAGRTIYICEGEKDVESLRANGQVATCNPGGAGKWREEYNGWLAGANVIVIQDRDGPGRKHAKRIETSLQGIARGIWVFQARSGKDVSDHLEAGFDVDELAPRKDRVRRGIISAKEMAESAMEHLMLGEHDLPGYKLSDEIPLVFRQGRTYVIGAYTGHGKTSFALPGLRKLCEQDYKVGYFTLEMPERDLMNKLVAHRGVPLSYTEEPWRLKQNPEMLQLYEQAITEISRWPMNIVYDSHISAEEITKYTEDQEFEVIFVDHLHKLPWGERRQFEQEMQKINAIALELNVCVIVLCQLRKFDTKQGGGQYPAPTLQSFRETSVVAEESSMALALWRRVEDDGISFSGETMAFVLKNRHTTGALDASGKSFYLNFDPEREMFVPRTQAQLRNNGAS